MQKDDRKEVERIRRKLNSADYGSDVEGVHTWDVATVFDDMRTLLKIATAALRTQGEGIAGTDDNEGDRTRCASCQHPFCKDCNEVDECCKCGTEQPRRTVPERLAQHEHIDIVDGVLGGVTPLVSRTRISVHHILTYLYHGNSIEYIAQTYRLSPEAIKDAIAFAQEVYDDATAAALNQVEGEGK